MEIIDEINGKIYMITCKTTGLRYIGQTVGCIENRFSSHLRGTRQPKFKMSKLQKDMEKYGHLDFEIKLLEDEIKDIDSLVNQEKYYIKKYGTINEYNSSKGGETKLRGDKTKNALGIKVDCRLSAFGFRDLSILEQNLWWAIVQLISNKGGKPLLLTRKEILECSEYEFRSVRPNDFKQSIKKMYQKISLINTQIYDEEKEEFILFSLFSVFEATEHGVVIQVSKYFTPWFNNIQKNFFLINASTLIQIKSGYLKELYRFLMSLGNPKSKKNGYWSVSIVDFRRLMCIPDVYNMADIKRYIIKPAIENFTSTNNGLLIPLSYFEVNLIVEKGAKKKVDRLEFSFTQNTSLKV